MTIKGKTILISGASSGIGFALTKKLISLGANVSVCSRNIASLEAISSSSLYVFCGDVRSFDDMKRWIQESLNRFSSIDVLINNAGVMYYMDMASANIDEMLSMIDVNCKGFIHVTQAALPELVKSGHGHIINITSDAGRRAFPGLAVYSGTKAFVEFTATAMRYELKDKGIKVTNIQPGNVDTDLHGRSLDTRAEQQYGSNDKEHFLSVDDIVAACVFALNQPQHAALNELLIEPQSEPI